MLREGVNKKIDFLGDMSPKLWPPPPINPFKEQKKTYYFLYISININLEPVQTEVTIHKNGFNKNDFSDSPHP